MRGAIALCSVKSASITAKPVRALSTVKRCPTLLPNPRSREFCVVFDVYIHIYIINRWVQGFGQELFFVSA